MTMKERWGRLIRARWLRGILLCGLVPAACPAAAQTLEALARAYRDKQTPAARAALDAHTRGQKKPAEAALARLAAGLIELERQRPAEALGYLQEMEGRLPALDDYASNALGRALFFAGRKQEALPALELVIARQPGSPLLAQAVLLSAQAYTDTGSPGKAVELLRRFLSQLPVSSSLLAYGNALIANGARQAGAVQLQRVFHEHPLSEEAGKAEALLKKLVVELGGDYPPVMPGAMLGRASIMLQAGHARKAMEELKAIVPRLGGLDRDQAKVRIGAALYRLEDNSGALAYLRTLTVPSSEADAERLHYLFQAARRLGRMEEAGQALEELNGRHAESHWRMETLVALGNYHLVSNQASEYEPLYRACAESFAASPRGDYCHWKVTWRHYLERRPDAADWLRRHLEQFPGSEQAAAALYYLGRIAESGNNPAVAKAFYQAVVSRYPNYYYAVVARQRLGARSVSAAGPSTATETLIASLPLEPPGRSVDFEIDPPTRKRLERARLLSAAGFADLAETELRFGARNDAKPGLVAVELARLATRRGAVDKGLRYIKSVSPGYLNWEVDQAPEQFWRLAFPLPYRAALEKYSRAQDLDPLLVAALVRQESEFDPKAVSSAKAIGLTQIRPPTGREISRKMGLRYRSSMLYEPEANLQMGTWYLKRMMDSLNGSIEATLAAYNAGQSRAVAWLQWGEFREPSEFIETIPFTETRNYVQTVLRNADMYRRLYAKPTGAVTSTGGNSSAQAARSSAGVAQRPF